MQHLVKIITEDLWFHKEDEIWLVAVNIIFQIEDVPRQAFHIPRQSLKGRKWWGDRIKRRDFSWRIFSSINYSWIVRFQFKCWADPPKESPSLSLKMTENIIWPTDSIWGVYRVLLNFIVKFCEYLTYMSWDIDFWIVSSWIDRLTRQTVEALSLSLKTLFFIFSPVLKLN